MKLKTHINTIEKSGNLKYEYNPFHNYQTTEDLYKISTHIGEIFIPKDKAVNINTGEILTKKITHLSNEEITNWVNENGDIIGTNENEIGTEGNLEEKFILCPTDNLLYAKAGSLIDFTTNLLNFDLNHPVDITILPSYDGSVNLILNDGKNIPRLINSRFSPREKSTYEIVDRIGENDTNIYSSNNFDKDTSLYFKYSSSPKIRFVKHIGGTLPVGQYCFYFTYCDADENESDIIAESGLIPTFIGSNGDPFSMDGGIKNQNSNKGIVVELKGLDKSYNYIKVYQFRYFADYGQNRVYECKKISNKYFINSSILYINISGNEEGEMIDPNILNVSTFNPKNVLTLAQCKNMLFFGNIVKLSDDYRELSDCALRIYPILKKNFISNVQRNYRDTLGRSGYYEINNMYNSVGYFPGEYYRFGVVFMYSDGTLSNVYNTLGYDCDSLFKDNIELEYNEKNSLYEKVNSQLIRKYIDFDENGWIIDSLKIYNKKPNFCNSKGVFRLNIPDTDSTTNISIQFKVHKSVVEYLKTLNIVGMFFVRLKRIPTILAQCYLLPMDKNLRIPVIPFSTGEFIIETFLDRGRNLTNSYYSRKYTHSNSRYISEKAYAAICPDFLLNLPYYNLIFNGAKFKLQKVTKDTILERLNGDLERFYTLKVGKHGNFGIKQEVKICSVTEEVPNVAIENLTYKLNIGSAELAYRFGFIGEDGGENNFNATNLVRGTYSPYLGIYSENKLEPGCLYNIYLEEELGDYQEFLDRMNSKEPYYSIGNRNVFANLFIENDYYYEECFRGDCYSNVFTYRLNRNFNDTTLPNNDEIIDSTTWIQHYTENSTDWVNISRSDVNAVKLGSWITIFLKSSINYALRSIDSSYVSENALMGSERSFYPRTSLNEQGANKRPDSYLYNDAYRETLGFKCYYTLEGINYLKNTFSNRIQYSSIAILDSYKNNFRHSLTTYFRDYSLEYGSILKLVGFEGYLLVVFEHAIGIATVNERVLVNLGDGEPVFINTLNVLPEELVIISDTYGTQWPESVIKSELGYVYGVDTVNKKIWRVKGLLLETISDFKVNKFLNKNITLSEQELYPIIGIKNVKTHYNNSKKDIMFTFYDDVYKDEEKVWNLCYNELLELFTTFYSWVPSYSENIDTQFFTFNRNTSKNISLLDLNNYYNYSSTGIVLKTPILNIDANNNGYTQICYREPISGKVKDSDKITFNIIKDHWGYNKYFTIEGNKLKTSNVSKLKDLMDEIKSNVIVLLIEPILSDNIHLKTQLVALSFEDKIGELKSDFYLHGNSGIYDTEEALYPTHWYGEFHPFEFEFIVNDKIGLLKIFHNLEIISNKAEPESFHFEIEGDNYEFSEDKRTMYFRLEATKELYQSLGSNIIFDRDYEKTALDKLTYELYYRSTHLLKLLPGEEKYAKEYDYTKRDKVYPIYSHGLVQQVKSTIFPLYYEKIDTYNDIYDKYLEMTGTGYDFKNLSGSEIKWNKDLNQFDVITHIKNSPINKVGILRGNSYYKEGKWNIQIPSIIFNLKNEEKWPNNIPPIIINTSKLPNDLTSDEISIDKVPNIYTRTDRTKDAPITDYIKVEDWTYRKETRIRDKWIKIKVRYSGKNLAVIHSLITLYNISYS